MTKKQTVKSRIVPKKIVKTRINTGSKKKSRKKTALITSRKFNKLHLAIVIFAFVVVGIAYTLLTHATASQPYGFYLRNSNTSGVAEIPNANGFVYGLPGDTPLACDWSGGGKATIGVYRNGTFYLRNSNTSGVAEIPNANGFVYGISGDKPICGDWNGDGKATIGVYRNGTFYLRNTNTAGAGDVSIPFGVAGDIPIACDFNGDHKTDIGIYRPSNQHFYLRDSATPGPANIPDQNGILFGIPGDKPICGDWNGDSKATIGLYRPSNSNFFLRNTNTAGNADIAISYGLPNDYPVVGDWDGNKTTTIGLWRSPPPPAAPSVASSASGPTAADTRCVNAVTLARYTCPIAEYNQQVAILNIAAKMSDPATKSLQDQYFYAAAHPRVAPAGSAPLPESHMCLSGPCTPAEFNAMNDFFRVSAAGGTLAINPGQSNASRSLTIDQLGNCEIYVWKVYPGMSDEPEVINHNKTEGECIDDAKGLEIYNDDYKKIDHADWIPVAAGGQTGTRKEVYRNL